MAKQTDMRHAERLHVEDGEYPGCLPGCLLSICTALCLLLMAALSLLLMAR